MHYRWRSISTVKRMCRRHSRRGNTTSARSPNMRSAFPTCSGCRPHGRPLCAPWRWAWPAARNGWSGSAPRRRCTAQPGRRPEQARPWRGLLRRSARPQDVLDRALDVLLELARRERLLHPQEHAQMGVSAQELEKLLRRPTRIAQVEGLAAGVALEIGGKHGDARLRTALVEQAAERGKPSALRDHDAVELDRVAREQDRDYLACEAAQRLLRSPLEHSFQILVNDPLAQIPDDAGEKLLLAAKVAIDRHLRDAGRGGDPVHAGTLETVAQEDILRPADNACPFDVETRHRGR